MPTNQFISPHSEESFQNSHGSVGETGNIPASHLKNTNTYKLPLDQLPDKALSFISSQLQQKELLSLICVSKKFYWPCVIRLYHSIAVVIEYFYPELITKYSSGYCTIMLLENAVKLYRSLTNNPMLLGLVQSMTFGPSVFNENAPLMPVKFLQAMYGMLNLESFHYMGYFGIDSRLFSNTLRRMSCLMLSHPTFPSNLVELKLIYPGSSQYHEVFEDLANEMIRHESYHNLRKLTFETQSYEPKVDNGRPEGFNFDKRPNWTRFFLTLAENGIKLNLTTLGIEGEFTDFHLDTVRLVCEALELKSLDTLDILYFRYETTPRRIFYGEGVHAFLDHITRNAPRLQYLSIKQTCMCYTFEFDALNRILRENMPHQLKQLHITMNDLSESERESKLKTIKHTILAYQQNLSKLKLNIGTFRHVNWNLDDIIALTNVHGDITLYLIKSGMRLPTTVNFPEQRPFVCESSLNTIKKYRKKILQLLRSDIIYTDAPKRLPFLTEYFIAGLDINIKELSILINGHAIHMED
ncbi:hypothetical protein JCM33374_g5477 [Metschnikowia sp. JCM 33374]|nr:hypothetical protein JCM33374_g5477 [Metschnikowia sp. JCM 33374]